MTQLRGLQRVSFFEAVPNADFTPEVLSIDSPYYRGPVERRALPSAALFAAALALLLIFIAWWALLLARQESIAVALSCAQTCMLGHPHAGACCTVWWAALLA